MKISSLSPALKKKCNVLCTRNLSFLIPLVLLLNLAGSSANATYTDYIGAGHDDGVSVDTCFNDDTATGQKTIDGSGLSGANHDRVWDNGWLGPVGATNPNPARSSYDRWIKYDFGEVYSLADMWVWNSNGATPAPGEEFSGI